MKLNYDLFEKAHLPDHILFTSGACHIFAIEMLANLPNEDYRLMRVAIDPELQSGYHVCCVDADGIFMADICGVKRVEDFRHWVESFLECKAVFIPVTEDELLTHSHEDEKGISFNQYNHIVDSSFIEYCRIRASLIINDFPARYEMSFYK
jgi:hypothetical protein